VDWLKDLAELLGEVQLRLASIPGWWVLKLKSLHMSYMLRFFKKHRICRLLKSSNYKFSLASYLCHWFNNARIQNFTCWYFIWLLIEWVFVDIIWRQQTCNVGCICRLLCLHHLEATDLGVEDHSLMTDGSWPQRIVQQGNLCTIYLYLFILYTVWDSHGMLMTIVYCV